MVSSKTIAKMNKNDRHNTIMELDYDKTLRYYKFIGGAKDKMLYYKNIYYEDKELLKNLVGNHEINQAKNINKKIMYPVIKGGNKKLEEENKRWKNGGFDKEYYFVLENIKESSSYKAYCSIDNEPCIDTATKLKDILCSLNEDYIFDREEKYSYWKVLIVEFINFILCCGNFYNDPRFEHYKLAYIVPITKVISNINHYAKFAQTHIDNILVSDSSLHIFEYHNLECAKDELKKTFGNEAKTKPKYIEIVKKEDDLIKKYGFSIILFNKISHNIRKNYFNSIGCNKK